MKGCGVRKVALKDDNIYYKTIGGEPAVPYSWPWAVLLNIFTESIDKCGASLISNQWLGNY